MNVKKRKSSLLTVFLIILLAFGFNLASYSQVREVKGTVTDASTSETLPGVYVTVKGTRIVTITNPEGKYTLANIPADAILKFTHIGKLSQEITVGNRTTIDVVMKVDLQGMEEVVVVGYGTKKKVNLTGAVSVASKELIESRPISNVQQALQGVVPNLIISSSIAGGEPGADMSMKIRGLTSFQELQAESEKWDGDSGKGNPYVLVDGIPMNMNDIDPNDIESISVLKDVASTSIYGARAAYGVILITTKRGQIGSRVSYSMNTAWSSPSIWPEIEQGIKWAHALNEAKTNAGGSPLYNADALNRLAQNLVEPGSAPGMLPNASGLGWDIMNTGTKGVANDDLTSLIVNKWAPRIKHNISVSGGNEKINYYVSGGYYSEEGLLKFGDESYKRYNMDGKINAKINSWMELTLLTKYKQGAEDFPWNQNFGRAWVMNWIGKLKPGTPAKYAGTDIWNSTTRVEEWKNMREKIVTNQFVASPRLRIEPIRGWVTNIELNYRTNQYENIQTVKQYPWVRPNGEIAYNPQNRGATEYNSDISTNTYMSPNIYSTYTTNFFEHNFQVMAGYQQEVYEYSNLWSSGYYLLSDGVPSLSTSVGEKTTSDGKGSWSTQGYFGRINYNYSEKYLLEMNIRTDGSSRFKKEDRWGVFPSASAGWVISKEEFFPLKDQVDLLKIRGSYGSIGNQAVANYLYVPTLPVSETWTWLFAGQRAWTVGAPNLTSVNLTWEKTTTLDIGIDALMLQNRLAFSFGFYDTRTTDLVGPGQELPAVLGTAVPYKNEGEIQTRGWEVEVSWKNRVNKDFSYQIRGVVSDYKSTVISYNNPNKLLSSYYDGEILGQIWGFETDGYFQSEEDIENHVDQSYIYSGTWNPGDMKYVDQNGDGKVDIGDNTVDDHGDLVVLGNKTPKYVFGLNASVRWKGFDFSFLLQGYGKRDLSYNDGSFRGPAAGPMHNNVLVGHLDYWRDDSSPLGANPNAYFPRPYAQYWGQNAKNFGYPTNQLIQNGSFLRLRNIRIGYSLPSTLTNRIFNGNIRFYISGENLLTFTKLMFYDPEAIGGRWYGEGDAYPISKTISLGLNINF